MLADATARGRGRGPPGAVPPRAASPPPRPPRPVAPGLLARAPPARACCGAEGPEDEGPGISAEAKAWLTEWSRQLETSLEDYRAALEAAEDRLGRREERLTGRLAQLQREGAERLQGCRRPSNASCPTPPARPRPRTTPGRPSPGKGSPEAPPSAARATEHAARQAVLAEPLSPPPARPRRRSLGEAASEGSAPECARTLEDVPPGAALTPYDVQEARWDDTLKCTENQVPTSHVWALLSAQGWLKNSQDSAFRDRRGSGMVLRSLMYTKQFTSRHDKRMQMFSVGLVLLNTVYMGVQASVSLRAVREGESLPDTYRYLDIIFVVLFVLELAARLFIERVAFFTGPHYRWNAFDSLLVITSLLDVMLFTLNLSFLRSLKAFRAVRAARMIKSITFVRELRLMVASILCSLSSLLWAFVLLTFVVYLFSIFLMQSLEVYANSIGRNPGGQLMQMFGTLLDSMYTLFCAISGGRDWYDIIKPFDEIWRGYRVIFVVYVIFVFFGVLNILTAIFVESAKHIAEIDRDIVIQDQITRDKSTMNEVRRIFNTADNDGSGKLRRDELEAVLRDDKTMKHLRVLELDIKEVEGLFQLLDIDDHNEVVIDEFVVQLMRLKGGAKGLDLQTVLYENKRIFLRLSAMMRFMEKHMGMLETRLDIQSTEEATMKEFLLDEEEAQRLSCKAQRSASSTASCELATAPGLRTG